jgi:LPXTG-motif cell wall-anchored protein
MPAPVRIGALIAILALLLPAAALAQSGDGGGAGDSQYQDPFGSSTQSKPSTPAQQQPAQQQTQTSPQPTPDHTDPAPAATAPATQAQAPAQKTQPAQTLPRTGFNVLPVAAAGLLLLLGGLALWRRPHGER